ncbi:hypothetical protein [Yeosuana marina]|uniref:hypothetical protein n=1 Tax=Yeosuana marina TaxID=1565536 RepID=UPI0030C8A7C1
MKKLIITIVLSIILVSITTAQIKKPVIPQNKQGTTNQTAVQGIQLPNLDRVTSAEIKKLRLPTVSITDAQKNAKPLTTWEITPLKPKYSSFFIEDYYGTYSLKGWELEPKPLFEGSSFSGFGLSAVRLNFRTIRGSQYLIRVKLKDLRDSWYQGKSILASAMNNSFAKYPIDGTNNEILIPFTANDSGNKIISISNIIINDKLYPYTIEKISIIKTQ